MPPSRPPSQPPSPSSPRAHSTSRRITRQVALRANGTGPHLTRARSAPRILGDRYELKRRIGAGGMAEVYLASDLVLERDVAVKVLHARWASDEIQIDRFRREALALATLDSPHIIPVYDMHLGPDEHYLVMRHVIGRTFEQLIDDAGPLAPERAARIVGDVLEGLAALHARRLVHRDIKPANVLVDFEDRAILVDLGVACDRRRRALTPAHVTIGTPDFMAPEQRSTGAVDQRSDLYQVGNLLLHALSGRDPTTLPVAERDAMIAAQPPHFARVIERALADDPEARWATAEVMRTALERASDSVPISSSDIVQVASVIVGDDEITNEVPDSGEIIELRVSAVRAPSPVTPLPRRGMPALKRPATPWPEGSDPSAPAPPAALPSPPRAPSPALAIAAMSPRAPSPSLATAAMSPRAPSPSLAMGTPTLSPRAPSPSPIDLVAPTTPMPDVLTPRVRPPVRRAPLVPALGLPVLCEQLPAPEPAPPPRRTWRWVLAIAAAALFGFAVTATLVIASSQRADGDDPAWTPRSFRSALRAHVTRTLDARRAAVTPTPAPIVVAAPAPTPKAAPAKPTPPRKPRTRTEEPDPIPQPAAKLPRRADPAEYLILADLYESSGRNDTAIEALRLFKQSTPPSEHAAIDQRIARLSRP